MVLNDDPNTKVLDDIFSSLGPFVSYEDFKGQVMGFIDMSLLPLTQVGAVPDLLQPISENTTWADIINDPPINQYNVIYAIKTYIYINVKLMLDPPAASVINVFEKRADEMIWRIRSAYEFNDIVEEV